MDQLTELLLGKYNERYDDYVRLCSIVQEELKDILAQTEGNKAVISARVKSRQSVKDKLNRKSGKYRSISEMTDIVGLRVVCYFYDQVDQIASIISSKYDIDKVNTVDKRVVIDPTTFGYVSLHYICSLPRGKGYPEELTDIKFEIQMRTMLQHTWAEIEHDFGYKSELAVPREVRRDFARVASLLEIADGYFLSIKNRLKEYENTVCESIKNDTADDMTLNRITLTEFIRSGKKMVDLNNDIAALSGAKLNEVTPDTYLPLLQFFNIDTIGDLKVFIGRRRDQALELASKILVGSEIEELISNVGLYYLCRSEIIYGDYDNLDVIKFCSLIYTKTEKINRNAEYIMKLKEQA